MWNLQEVLCAFKNAHQKSYKIVVRQWPTNNKLVFIQYPELFLYFQVLWELTQGKLGEAPAPPTAVGAPSTSKEEEVAEPDESELDEMQTRLQALRS